jgi:alpha-mannosidase
VEAGLKSENFMKEGIVVHLVPSAHWDREWYLPFSRYQVKLVRLMDKVISLLETGKYPFTR